MNCPHCDKPMKALTTHSKYGAHIEIDQCGDCGGLWFDDLEYYPVKEGLAEAFDKIDKEKLVRPDPVKKAGLYCPRDNTILKAFSDPYWPNEIRVEHCPQCSGFWFNRGEFSAFQKERQKRQVALKSAGNLQLSAEVRGLLNAEGTGNKYDSVGRLGRFLSQDMKYAGSMPMIDHGLSEELGEDAKKFMNFFTILMYIVRLLLKIFLKV